MYVCVCVFIDIYCGKKKQKSIGTSLETDCTSNASKLCSEDCLLILDEFTYIGMLFSPESREHFFLQRIFLFYVCDTNMVEGVKS